MEREYDVSYDVLDIHMVKSCWFILFLIVGENTLLHNFMDQNVDELFLMYSDDLLLTYLLIVPY